MVKREQCTNNNANQGINITIMLSIKRTNHLCICVRSQKALQDFVLEQTREDELHCLPEKMYIQDENAFFNDNRLGKKDKKLLSTTKGLQKNLYFSLPGTQLSIDFFQEQV